MADLVCGPGCCIHLLAAIIDYTDSDHHEGIDGVSDHIRYKVSYDVSSPSYAYRTRMYMCVCVCMHTRYAICVHIQAYPGL